jgi:hypothetical protein
MAWEGSGTLITESPVVASSYTLAGAMLDLARLLGGLRSGTATGGSVTTLVDTLRNEEAEFWKGGTIWITSGSNKGICYPILSFSGNTITLPVTLTSAIVNGDEYSVFPPEYPLDVLRHAIQSALNELGEIVNYDETLTTDTDDESYELPEGVYNIFRVEIAQNDAAPYGYSISYFWRELNGYIYFIPSKKPGMDGYKMRIWYKAPHAEVFSYNDEIADAIDRNWLSWAGVANVLRNSLGIRGKDKAISIDLLNQAIMREQELRNRQNKKKMVFVNPDPILNP